MAVSMAGVAHAAQAPNPRGGNSTGTAGMASSGTSGGPSGSVTTASRAGRNVVSTTARSATPRTTAVASRAGTTTTVSARSGARHTVISTPTTSRSAIRQKVVNAIDRIGRSAIVTTSGAGVSRAASSSVARGAVTSSSMARSGAKTSNVSRAASTRATAVFDDISKIGGGYAACRDSYNTCMDQFCAKANETYRRCYCSNRYIEFKDIEAGIDAAKTLLMQFQDNNLAAVGLSEGEANAMYTATVGEAAIKNDTSAAASMLSEIADLLAGKKKNDSATVSTSGSLGVLSFDFSSDIQDAWSGSGQSNNSFFGGTNARDLSTMEGLDLYNAANEQCKNLLDSSCDNSAALNMARSAYNILISQDCNAYKNTIDVQKQAVLDTTRQAEKFLMEARLEEYRSHNSADVNECMEKVKNAITGDMVCGANYKKCLDNTGNYVNASTGEAIYSPKLFQLEKLINLYSNDISTDTSGGDILSKNSGYNAFLDSKREFANSALDTCRDKADLVWTEFKRSAIIEIAQAQSALIEDVKSSCVSTMAQCYDEQSGQMKKADTTTSQYSGAISAYAAKEMCMDQVAACAALYRNPNNPNEKECEFDGNGNLLNGNECGLAALRTFVNVVDNVKVAEGCKTALSNYLAETCAPPSNSTYKYPWGCRSLTAYQVADMLWARAVVYCKDPAKASDSIVTDTNVVSAIDELIKRFSIELYAIQEQACFDMNGMWVEVSDSTDQKEVQDTGLEPAYYSLVSAGEEPQVTVATEKVVNVDNAMTKTTYNDQPYGYCIKNTVRNNCLAQDEATGGHGYAKYDATRNQCTFSEEWYNIQCTNIGGYRENYVCYIK